MSDRIPVSGHEYCRLINQTIRRHRKYRYGMMVEMVPHDVRPEGYSVVCNVPGVFEVVTEATAEVNAKLFVLAETKEIQMVSTCHGHNRTSPEPGTIPFEAIPPGEYSGP